MGNLKRRLPQILTMALVTTSFTSPGITVSASVDVRTLENPEMDMDLEEIDIATTSNIVDRKETDISETCGDNLAWELKEGILTVSGSGAMESIQYKRPAWYDRRKEIESIVIEEGVTSTGACAFEYCTGLKTAAIAESVSDIGTAAFRNCEGLSAVDMENGKALYSPYLIN